MIIKGDLDRMAEDIGHADRMQTRTHIDHVCVSTQRVTMLRTVTSNSKPNTPYCCGDHAKVQQLVESGGLKTMLGAMEVPSHARDLLLQLNSQRTKGFLCDVIIVVQNALFRAHKNILAASSLYLKSLVVHDNLINLDHEMVSPGVFRVILDYIYTGRLSDGDPTSPTEPNLGAVLAAASYLQLLDLVALCKKKLKRNGKYPPRPGPAFLPYPKMGPNSMGLGSGGRYRVSTPVIQSCPPGGILNSHATRAPPLEGASSPSTSPSCRGAVCPHLQPGLSGVPVPALKMTMRTEDEEEGGENGEQHHNHHKAGEESEGADDKSGSGTEETGSSEGRPSPPGSMGRFHMPYEPESFGDNLYVCIPCDKGFPSSEQLNAHVETHTEEELYGNSGGEMGNSNNSSTKNMTNNTNGYGSLNSSNSLNSLSHLETKTSQGLGSGGIGEMIRPYRCNSCEKSYKDPATLRQHEKTHWLTRPYPCSICGKKFTQRGTMTRHMRSHLGLKPFACDSCGMRFTRQYRLT
ncbi:Hypermethylated in cancer 1 protein [Collichthys lucidus]|uniref:Hypermethylated in cancer 1 protein n=1 Tax=Collichthys lucidus TaxID=240159 RepID=A0A4U5UZM8_COLLU|nr:Hypermethylated in cancer 1 protein [Collichthys lucidus]